jgi:molecular chaperone GrpE
LGIEELVKRLLPVIDNLDIVLASKSDNPEVQNFIYGVDMIRSEFLKILQNYQIVPIVDKGDKFNPNLMEAIDVEIIDDLKEEVVTEVYKKAYVKYYDLQNKDKFVVLRTATVKVGKPRQVNLNNEPNNTSNQNSNNENHQNEKNEIKN